jgi:hypothetical protein
VSTMRTDNGITELWNSKHVVDFKVSKQLVVNYMYHGCETKRLPNSGHNYSNQKVLNALFVSQCIKIE